MQVKNCTNAPLTIAGVYTIAPGAVRDFDDALWATLRPRKAVAYWLDHGSLQECAEGSVGIAPVASAGAEGAVAGVVAAINDAAPAPETPRARASKRAAS